MYAVYYKETSEGYTRFRFQNRTHLFGCRSGLIPRSLLRKTGRDQNEPYRWHLSMKRVLPEDGSPRSAIVIDLKPKQADSNLSLYELRDVWGYSDSGWSPVLIHLNVLYSDADPSNIDRLDFRIQNREQRISVYEFLYLQGSISGGRLTGKWTAPPVSPTNAALLWPAALKYFVGCIRACTPDLLS